MGTRCICGFEHAGLIVAPFQFGGFDPGEQVKIGNFSDTDFTVLVCVTLLKHLKKLSKRDR
jgi:hypothetical protein